MIRAYASAGGLVVEAGRVLVLERPGRRELRLPKGHIEPGETPRQARDTLTRSAYLDGASTAALDTVVATLERARYAAPGADLPDVTADSELVARTARSRRRLTMRIRAWLWPLEGRRAWGEMWNSVDRRGR